MVTAVCDNLLYDLGFFSTIKKNYKNVHTHLQLSCHHLQLQTNVYLTALFFLLSDIIKIYLIYVSNRLFQSILYTGFLKKKNFSDYFKQIIKLKVKLSARDNFRNDY